MHFNIILVFPFQHTMFGIKYQHYLPTMYSWVGILISLCLSVLTYKKEIMIECCHIVLVKWVNMWVLVIYLLFFCSKLTILSSVLWRWYKNSAKYISWTFTPKEDQTYTHDSLGSTNGRFTRRLESGKMALLFFFLLIFYFIIFY